MTAVLLGGEWHGRELRNATTDPPHHVISTSRRPLFPTGRIMAGPRPPVWRYRAWRAWTPTEPAPPEPDMPPLVYRYAGRLDDGTLVYRYDDDATADAWTAFHSVNVRTGEPAGIPKEEITDV